ncbi:hypothetical protein [uncultured Methanobrevibacter sp.]|uniref:hypothetical protein n=1 Tax=uncultured Methanobrevibacter sp. TaxID=253161 RepID=UPI0026046C95|nr:hypothetical protein [uncultured Methanobrevibacter sp.]
MDIKKIKIIGIATVIAIIALSAAYAAQDNVIEIENIKFNTTNITEFTFYSEDSYDNDTGIMTTYCGGENNESYITIYNESKMNQSGYKTSIEEFMAEFENLTTQTVDEIQIYENETEDGMMYYTVIDNDDLQTSVFIECKELNETVKIASTLEFK